MRHRFLLLILPTIIFSLRDASRLAIFQLTVVKKPLALSRRKDQRFPKFHPL